jgi:hypothetical protein
VAVVLAGTLAACGLVEGLSSYSEGECSGGSCDAGDDTAAAADQTTIPEAGVDVAIDVTNDTMGVRPTSDGSTGCEAGCVDQTCVAGACTGVCAVDTTKCSNNGVETCGAEGQWGTPVACTGQTCVDGVCSGTCAPNQVQCSGNTPQTCGESGTWTSGTACASQTCVAGVCSGTCAPGQTQCLGNLVQSCSASGGWQTQTTCAGNAPACLDSTCVACSPTTTQCAGNSYETCSAGGSWGSPVACVNETCINGACTGVCAPGQTQCSGNGVQTCTTSGTWGGAVACTGSACVNGACAGSCSPGALQCSGNGVQTCSSGGSWGTAAACTNQTCINGVCTGTCAPTQVTCSGNNVETCTANGTYGSDVACNGQTCVNGVCTGVCAPGQTDCSGNTTQNCSTTGTWQNLTTCAQPTPSCVNGSCTCTETTCGSTCTLLNTPTDCSACGDVCNLTNASSATCSGSKCSYGCNTGASDCNFATAPDTDGCECLTPACCPGGTNTGAPCQTTHSDGLGNSYYDCNNVYTVSPNTFTPVTAMEACTAYAVSQGKAAPNCSDGWSCAGQKLSGGGTDEEPDTTVCYCSNTTNATDCANTCTYCWGYSANTDGAISDNGWVETCTCPETKATTYN